MRLLTHNMLACPVRACGDDGFPLRIVVEEVEFRDTPADEINFEFLVRLLDKIEWPALVQSSRELQRQFQLPDELPADARTNEEFLLLLQRVVIDTVLTSGSLVCPKCGLVYEVANGIPNLLLKEDEV